MRKNWCEQRKGMKFDVSISGGRFDIFPEFACFVGGHDCLPKVRLLPIDGCDHFCVIKIKNILVIINLMCLEIPPKAPLKFADLFSNDNLESIKGD